jgi:OOP family OmpA-OmpF porin
METTMIRLPLHSRAVGATFAFILLAGGLLAGCAAGPVQTVSNPNNTWYQVFFDSNKADVDARGRMVTDSVAKAVKANAATHVTIVGKADSVGTAASNMTLSHRRADEVRATLIAAGVPAARINTHWAGEGSRDVKSGDQADEQRNRVVDIGVIQDKP